MSKTAEENVALSAEIDEEPTKICRGCRREFALVLFAKSAQSNDGRAAYCPNCDRRRGKNAQGAVENPSAGATKGKQALEQPVGVAERAEPVEATTPQPGPDAAHVHFLLSGDAAIEKEFPGFFVTHEPAPKGYVWEVCTICGEGRQVQAYSPEDISPGTFSIKRNVSAERKRGMVRLQGRVVEVPEAVQRVRLAEQAALMRQNEHAGNGHSAEPVPSASGAPTVADQQGETPPLHGDALLLTDDDVVKLGGADTVATEVGGLVEGEPDGTAARIAELEDESAEAWEEVRRLRREVTALREERDALAAQVELVNVEKQIATAGREMARLMEWKAELEGCVEKWLGGGQMCSTPVNDGEAVAPARILG